MTGIKVMGILSLRQSQKVNTKINLKVIHWKKLAQNLAQYQCSTVPVFIFGFKYQRVNLQIHQPMTKMW